MFSYQFLSYISLHSSSVFHSVAFDRLFFFCINADVKFSSFCILCLINQFMKESLNMTEIIISIFLNEWHVYIHIISVIVFVTYSVIKNVNFMASPCTNPTHFCVPSVKCIQLADNYYVTLFLHLLNILECAKGSLKHSNSWYIHFNILYFICLLSSSTYYLQSFHLYISH